MNPKQYREYKIYKLYTEQKMSHKQIAELMDCSVGTVNSDLHAIPESYKDQSDLNKLADKCKGRAWFCGPDHIVGQCENCFWGIIGDARYSDLGRFDGYHGLGR